MDLLKARQLNESGHRLGPAAMEKEKALKEEEWMFQIYKECENMQKKPNNNTHNHTESASVQLQANTQKQDYRIESKGRLDALATSSVCFERAS